MYWGLVFLFFENLWVCYLCNLLGLPSCCGLGSVTKIFFGLSSSFFCLKVEQIYIYIYIYIFFFFKFEGVPNT